MKTHWFIFVLLFFLGNASRGQTFHLDALDTLAIKLQTEFNKVGIPDSIRFRSVYRVNRKVVGLEQWRNGDWDVYLRDSPSFKDSVYYDVYINKHPSLDTVEVDVSFGGSLFAFGGYHEYYGDFRGGPNAFMSRAKDYLKENLSSMSFRDTIVLFFDTKRPSNLLVTIGTNPMLEKAFSNFFADREEMHRPGLWYGIASALMYSSHVFEVVGNAGDIKIDYIGAEDFVSVSFDENRVCGASFRGGVQSFYREDAHFFYDRKLPLSYYKEHGLLKDDELTMKCFEGLFERKPLSGMYSISTFKR